MNATESLCDAIALPEKMKSRVVSFSRTFDFSAVGERLLDFRTFDRMHAAMARLQQTLGEDPDGVKILACMLKASADLQELYRQKGISERIYYDTMACYTRFLRETETVTGRLFFDRYWWTCRQAGFHLFRIGQLEYERKATQQVISIHIPSDAVLTPAAVGSSLQEAKLFFGLHFPETDLWSWQCHSWLLSGELVPMLPENSNIRRFRDRFHILSQGERGDDYIQWLFRTEETDPRSWREDTSLQRRVKAHVLTGGVIRNARGILKDM